MPKTRTITAVIPARAGSVRIKNKNLMEIGVRSLVERKIAQLQASCLISEVVLGTNCEIAAGQARACGATVLWREDFFCDESKASANEMIADLAARVTSDLMVWAHCTNPFIYGTTYDAAIEAYDASLASGYDSLASVYKVQSHMWNSDEKPENFNPQAPRHPLARDLKPVYFQDGGIFIQAAARFRETSYFYGERPKLFELTFPSCHDINTPEDLDVARRLAPDLDKELAFG